MKKKQLFILAGIAVVVLSLALGGVVAYRENQGKAEATAEQSSDRQSLLVRPDSHAQGPVNAKVTLVEFFDPECESCSAVFPDLKQMLQYYGGDVRLVVRYMPLHPNSMQAATALEAAAEQGKFWELLAMMFERQAEWADHHAPKPELIPTYAKEVGLDLERFKASAAKPEHRTKIERDKADGLALGVDGTPSFFVNGRRLEELNFVILKQMIDGELTKP